MSIVNILYRYNLHVITIESHNYKQGLQEIKEQYPHIKAIFMGTRRTDPYSGTYNINLRLRHIIYQISKYFYAILNNNKICNGLDRDNVTT